MKLRSLIQARQPLECFIHTIILSGKESAPTHTAAINYRSADNDLYLPYTPKARAIIE
jgi:hypothetical protein